MQFDHRAAPFRAVVRRMKEIAEPAIDVVKRWQCPLHPERYAGTYTRLDGEHPRLVHLPPALVGTSHPDLEVRRMRGIYCGEDRAGRVRECGSKNLEQDPDVLDTWFSSALGRLRRWAGPKTARAGRLLPDIRAWSPRATSSTFGWLKDDHDEPELPRRDTVPGCIHIRYGPERGRPANEQVARHWHRSSRVIAASMGCDALQVRADPADRQEPGHPLLRGQGRGDPVLQQQDMEHIAFRPAQPRSDGGGAREPLHRRESPARGSDGF